jgi:hypothetical protein
MRPEPRRVQGSHAPNVVHGGFPIEKNLDDFIKSLLKRHPGESRGPECREMKGFERLPRT